MSDELDIERKKVESDHLCGCDVCSRGGPVCPASAGTLIDELAQLRIALRKLKASQVQLADKCYANRFKAVEDMEYVAAAAWRDIERELKALLKEPVPNQPVL